MKKNVVIISSSLRKDSNSEALAKAFMNGAIEGGNEVEMISLAGKKIEFYFLSCAAEDEEETVVGAKTAVQGWIDCFGKAKLSGVVFAGGVNSAGDIKGQPASMEAYEMGKQIQ